MAHLYQNDPTTSQYVDQFLQILHQHTGVRGDWFQVINNLFTGKTQPNQPIDIHHFTASLIQIFQHSSSIIPHPSHAITLEIDTSYLLKLPLYTYPIGQRPLDVIIPAPYVPKEAITAVYASPQWINDIQNTPFPIQFLNNISPSIWLNQITPQEIQKKGINPRQPLCQLKYNNPPSYETSIPHLQNSRLAPFFPQSINLQEPQSYPDKMWQQLIKNVLSSLQNEEHISDLLSIIASHFSPQPILSNS